MPRINLENVPGRKSMDAEWSKKKKAVVGGIAGVIGAGAIAGGAWTFMQAQPPGLPRTADEAMATIRSAKFEQLDPGRKEQILAESRRLLSELSWEERREIMGDREAQRAMMEASMDETARRLARGEDMRDIMGSMWGGRGGPGAGGGPGGERPEMTDEQRREAAAEWERRRQEREAMTDEERAAEQKEREAEMRARFESQLSTGNAQNSGLRGEMFKRMGQMGRGFRGRGGGGPGGGGRGRGGGG